MRRHPVGATHLLQLESPRGHQFRVRVVDRVVLLLEAERHHDGLERSLWPAMRLVPLLAEPLERLRLVGLVGLDVRADLGAVAEERAGVQFRRPSEGDRVLRQGRGHVAAHAVR